MTKTYAAFYLPEETAPAKFPEQKNVDRITASVRRAVSNAKMNLKNIDISEMARNIDLQSTTEFTQRYAVGALTDIINGNAVTNKTMLDSLFNTYAPALNAGLAQTGFNSLVEMRNAVQAGNINVANFIQGFSNGLSAVQEMSIEKPAKYGEEIPIDVVDKIEYVYSVDTTDRKINRVFTAPKYISDLDNVVVTIFAHVKNENAELWSTNDFGNKIVDIMQNKEKIIFRVGKSIFEDCIIIRYEPTITNIHDIYFEADIKFDYYANSQSQVTQKNIRIMNPIRRLDDSLYNMFCNETYRGIIV